MHQDSNTLLVLTGTAAGGGAAGHWTSRLPHIALSVAISAVGGKVLSRLAHGYQQLAVTWCR